MAERFSAIARLLHRRGKGLARGAPLALPIVASTSFHLPGEPVASHVYGRYANPTTEEVEAALGLIEDAETLLFPSGMAAMAGLFHAYLRPGDRILVHSDGYYNVRAFLERFFVPIGVEMVTCPTADMHQADLAGYRLILAETPSNPGLDICDLRVLSGRAKSAGALLAVDNTTATPFLQRPLDLGADFSVTADTKAMSGHSDILAGHIASRDPALMEPVRAWRRLGGAIISPFDAFLLHRGLLTAELRLQRASANALATAQALSTERSVTALRYPGLASDRGHERARRQMRSYGPVLSFCLPDRDHAERFIAAHPLLGAATSFGGVHACAECRIRWGDEVPDGFIRMSCGIEPTEDFLAATREALEIARAGAS